MTVLPPFPAAPGTAPDTPAPLLERGFFLRHATAADLLRLADVYADTRADEMAMVPWPAMAKRSFLDSQFELQHRHYLAHYADSDFLVIEHHGVVQGRYYLLRTPPDHLVVDISLMAALRGQGVGAALLRQSQADAAAAGRGLRLSVAQTNPRALALYERLGFVLTESGDTHHRMRWTSPG